MVAVRKWHPLNALMLRWRVGGWVDGGWVGGWMGGWWMGGWWMGRWVDGCS